MERKKILITIDWFLPGTKSGGPVRSYANMIAHLSRYFDFYIITRDTDYCSEEVYSTIQSNAWNRWNEHTQIYYFSKDQLTKENLKTLLSETSFDRAYINGIYSWYFSILPLWLLKDRSRVIVAARGMLNPQAFSVKGPKKKIFLAIASLFKLYKGVVFHATNSDEAEHIKESLGNTITIKIAPNLPRLRNDNVIIEKQKHHPARFVNIARISIEKGTLKTIEALHHVKHEMILDLYGPIYDKAYWEKCQNSIKSLPQNVTVSYKGVLPSEEVPQTFDNYDFFVLLSEGENFGHAILEALTAGCPVIISDKTPWKELSSKSLGWDVSLDSPPDIVFSFEHAIQMSATEYSLYSSNAQKFSRTFIENPELLMLNLELFK